MISIDYKVITSTSIYKIENFDFNILFSTKSFVFVQKGFFFPLCPIANNKNSSLLKFLKVLFNLLSIFLNQFQKNGKSEKTNFLSFYLTFFLFFFKPI